MGSGNNIAIAVVTALLAGLCLAGTGLLQQQAASRRPKREQLSPKLILSLVKNKKWLAGIGTAFGSYGFQAVALATGPLALVQPLIVSELLFAVPVSIRLRGVELGRKEWLAIVAVIAGLTIGVVGADPHKGSPVEPISMWAFALGGVFVIALGAVLLGRSIRGPKRATLFAFAGAAVLALQSGLYAATIALLRQNFPSNFPATFTTWYPYALIIASFTGMFLVENAYQAGPLAASMPVMDATLPSASIAIGVGLFGEHIRTSAVGLTAAAVGIVLLLVGIVALDTSNVVRKTQNIEQEQRGETAENVRD